MIRRVVAAAFAAVLAVGTPAAAQDTTAVSVVTRDGASVFHLAFHIHRTVSDVVDSGNAAVAVASGCSACEAVAISIQVVLVASEPSVLTPENLALAMNVACDACTSFASAYQFVLGTDGAVRFTPEGSRELAAIRAALLGLRTQDLTLEQLAAEVGALVDRLATVLANEMVEAGPPSSSEPSPSPSPAPTEPVESASPSPTVAPDDSPSVSPSHTPSASESPSPTPSGSVS